MIEQVKFTYFFFLGKAFEKLTKRIADQGEKQIKSIEENEKQLYYKQPGNNESLLLKEREIYKSIYNKTLDKIDELSKAIDCGNLKFIISNSGTETIFSELKDPVAFLIALENVKYQLKKHGINKKNLTDI